MCLEYHCGHGKEVSNPHAFQDDPGTRRRPRRSCRLQRQLDQRWLGYERLDRLGRGRSLCSLSVSGCSARVTCAGAKTRSLPTRVVGSSGGVRAYGLYARARGTEQLGHRPAELVDGDRLARSEEHTSELQSPYDLVCRLLLEKKKEAS